MPLPETPAAASRPRRLREEVFDAINAAIIDGTFEPGETLREEELMAWLGVSQIPIRQALDRLAEIGVLDRVPGKYTRVAPLDLALINQALYVTGVLHEFAAATCVATMSDRDLETLDKHFRDARSALERSDRAHLGAAIRDFFFTFEKSTGNRVLAATAEDLFDVLHRFLTPRDMLTAIEVIVERLGAINAAAQARDAETARARIHELYAPTRKNFIEIYRPQLVGTDPE